MAEMSVLETTYRSITKKKTTIAVCIFAAAAAISFLSIFVNHYTGLSFDVSWDVLIAHLNGHDYDVYYYNLIVWEYFTPRAIMAVFVGAGLAVGGVVMQSMLRNPIADPYTTGVSSGASFGVALYLMLGFSLIPVDNYSLNITVNATLFALIPTAAIVLISRRKNMTPTTTILAGVAVMYVFRAATSIMTLSADPDAVEQLYYWNVGTLVDARWSNIWIVVGMTTVCSVFLMFLSRQMTIMTTGDNSAKSIGVRTKLVRTVALITVALLTATIVGYVGTIGFMGLIAPHVARIFVGSNLKYLIPCSAACGALILIACDVVTKVIVSGVPVGVITSVVGGPLFIVLLIKGARKVWY